MRHRIGLIVALVMLLVAPTGRAQTFDALVESFAFRLPGATLFEMRKNPDKFLEEVSGLILGFGSADGIDAKGLLHAVQAERARLRAREIRRLLEADLNGDLQITSEERDVLIRISGARKRGQLLVWFMHADTDADGIVAWSELQHMAAGAALVGLSPSRARFIQSLMTLDVNGDGVLTVAEVQSSLKLFVPNA